MCVCAQNFEVKADDLEPIGELGRGAYGVVDKMKHVPSGIIMAVKVRDAPMYYSYMMYFYYYFDKEINPCNLGLSCYTFCIKN